MSFLDKLPKPFFVLAPMDDVTDTVFRQIIADCAPPDLYFTEFVNVDGLQSPGREHLLHKLRFSPKEKPIIAQLWGLNPDNFYKTARELKDGTLVDEIEYLRARNPHSSKVQGSQEKRARRIDDTMSEPRTTLTPQFTENIGRVAGLASKQANALRFSGIDLNMGCPVKTVIKNGACAALINNRELAGEIIEATREGVGKDLPVSLKTRVGFTTSDLSWFKFLLPKKLDLLSIHGRTARQKPQVLADWGFISEVRELRDLLCPSTKIVGNGDIVSRAQGLELAGKYKLDGIMIGRGVFNDPFIFAGNSPWPNWSKQQKLELYRKHVELFAQTWEKGERRTETLNKFYKVYVSGFDGAKELREKLMRAKSTQELLISLSTP